MAGRPNMVHNGRPRVLAVLRELADEHGIVESIPRAVLAEKAGIARVGAIEALIYGLITAKLAVKLTKAGPGHVGRLRLIGQEPPPAEPLRQHFEPDQWHEDRAAPRILDPAAEARIAEHLREEFGIQVVRYSTYFGAVSLARVRFLEASP